MTVLFGGSTFLYIRDLLYMMGKTTNLVGSSGSFAFNSKTGSVYNGSISDVFPGFYCDVETTSENKMHNRVFHSFVLFDETTELLDPYIEMDFTRSVKNDTSPYDHQKNIYIRLVNNAYDGAISERKLSQTLKLTCQTQGAGGYTGGSWLESDKMNVNVSKIFNKNIGIASCSENDIVSGVSSITGLKEKCILHTIDQPFISTKNFWGGGALEIRNNQYWYFKYQSNGDGAAYFHNIKDFEPGPIMSSLTFDDDGIVRMFRGRVSGPARSGDSSSGSPSKTESYYNKNMALMYIPPLNYTPY